jgi:TolB-like protein
MQRTLKLLLILPFALAGFLMAGCETTPDEPTYEEAANDLLRFTNYLAIDTLMGRVGKPSSASNQSSAFSGAALIVATMANVDALEKSSTLGRVISEHIGSRLTQNGHSVVELKVRQSIYMKNNEGEFLLTRQIKEVAAAHNAQGVVVGFYAISSRFVQVTLKLIDPESGLVLSAYDYTLPLDKQIKSMVRR